MANEIFKPTGSTRASRPDAGGANIRTVPILAIVKSNIDPTRSGRISVYVSDFGGDPTDSSSWITVKYMSPFYGRTDPSGPGTGYGDFLTNSGSYGVWNSPPDIGTTVICIFINGDMNAGSGFYIGCVPEPEALHMVPAIGSSTNVVTNEGEANSYGGATRLPVTNINSNNTGISNGGNFLNEAKPVHSYAAGILSQQGLLRDPIRGAISSSAQRESPSRVGYGVSTPGRPIYEGGFDDQTIASNLNIKDSAKLKVVARRSGHTFVMDDGDILGRDQLVRLRTSAGHQILMSDDGQCLHIIHANGQSWIELGKEGTIDMYATNSVNIRTQGDLNLHADNNVNINAAKALNISADSINIESAADTKIKVGSNFNMYAAATYTVKVDSGMSMSSGGEASYASGSTTYINGSVVNLNTGSTSLVPSTVPAIARVAHTDTLFDSVVGFAAAPGKLQSIVSRAPAHAPWASAGQGVDVKVSVNASSNLPAAPTPAVAAANATAPTPVNPVTAAVAATVPPTSAVSAALDKNTTAALVGQVSTLAASGPAAAAVQLGAGVVNTAAGPVASIGAFAASAENMCSAGYLKPGAAPLISALISGGKTIDQALSPNMFTGKDGISNLTALVNNPGAQVSAVVSNLKSSQSALEASGAITGNMSSNSIAGPILAGAIAGPVAALGAIAGTGAALGVIPGASTALGAASGLLGSLPNALSAGAFASKLAGSVTGGLSSIAGGLSGAITSAQGVAAGAFSAVTSAFKALGKPGVPQNLTAIAAKNAADSAGVDETSAYPTNPVDVAAAASDLAAYPPNPLLSGNLTAGALTAAAGAAYGAAASAPSPGISNITQGMTAAQQTANKILGNG